MKEKPQVYSEKHIRLERKRAEKAARKSENEAMDLDYPKVPSATSTPPSAEPWVPIVPTAPPVASPTAVEPMSLPSEAAKVAKEKALADAKVAAEAKAKRLAAVAEARAEKLAAAVRLNLPPLNPMGLGGPTSSSLGSPVESESLAKLQERPYPDPYLGPV